MMIIITNRYNVDRRMCFSDTLKVKRLKAHIMCVYGSKKTNGIKQDNQDRLCLSVSEGDESLFTQHIMFPQYIILFPQYIILFPQYIILFAQHIILFPQYIIINTS